MPELPEVQTVVDSLAPILINRKITAVKHLRGDILTPAGFDLAQLLAGKLVLTIHRRAKRIVFSLDDCNRFYIHLGMSGRLTVTRPEQPRAPHTHLVIEFGESELRFVDPRRFGGIWWMGQSPDDPALGPEPLSLRSAEFGKRLAGTRRAIKSALLDQYLIAGLGNIYVDESLFVAGVHPLMPANKLSPAQIQRLSRAIKQVLRRSIKARGSSLRDYVDANGERGSFQKLHKVYDRADQPCRTCKTSIRRIVLTGRSTHFCPQCQKRSSA